MGSHIINGKFQSDKYPTCPPGKVPLSVTDTSAQDLLWAYAQRRRPIDAEFASDLEQALTAAGFATDDHEEINTYSIALGAHPVTHVAALRKRIVDLEKIVQDGTIESMRQARAARRLEGDRERIRKERDKLRKAIREEFIYDERPSLGLDSYQCRACGSTWLHDHEEQHRVHYGTACIVTLTIEPKPVVIEHRPIDLLSGTPEPPTLPAPRLLRARKLRIPGK